jgi:hypothetical protein
MSIQAIWNDVETIPIETGGRLKHTEFSTVTAMMDPGGGLKAQAISKQPSWKAPRKSGSWTKQDPTEQNNHSRVESNCKPTPVVVATKPAVKTFLHAAWLWLIYQAQYYETVRHTSVWRTISASIYTEVDL